MSIPYSHGTSFDTASCVQCWIEYPFQRYGNTSTKIYHHIMVQHGDSYTPGALNTVMTTAGAKPARSLFPDDSSAYFCEDRGLSPMGDNLVTFDRIFANIPTGFEEGGGNFSFTFPVSPNASNYTCNANRFSLSGNTLLLNIANANSPFFQVGDTAIARQGIAFTPTGGISQTRSYSRWLITGNGGDNSAGSGLTRLTLEFETSSGGLVTSFGLSTFSLDRVGTLARSSAITLNSESILTYRFVKTDSINSERFEDAFSILAYGGADYVQVDTLGTATLPDESLYQGMTKSGSFIQAEPETPSRWLGNIWMIVGRKVRAR